MSRSADKEHILVCLSSAPSNAKIIETAAKMAEAFGGAFTALYVQTPASELMLDEDKARLSEHIRYAEELGANVATVIGDDVAFQIAEFSRLSGITKVVLGRSVVTKKRIFKKPTLTEQLTELAASLDIYIIPDTAAMHKAQKIRLFGKSSITSALKSLGISAIILLSATALCVLFNYLGFSEDMLLAIYIIAALLASVITDSPPCWVITALAGATIFNFAFISPELSLEALGDGHSVIYLLMLLSSLVTGSLTARMKTQAKRSAKAAYRTKILLDTNQMLSKARCAEEIFEIAASQTEKLLSSDVRIIKSPSSLASLGISSTEITRSEDGVYYPIHTGDTLYGALCIEKDKTANAFENSILLSILGECALALESERNAREKEASAILAEKEKFRANLLRTISHDLRTPLTSISGNAGNLIANDDVFDPETRRAIYRDIREDSEWLMGLVENLLSVSRMGEGKGEIRATAELVSDVIEEAVRRTEKNAGEHTISVRDSEQLLLAKMDARLIVQVLINLIDNAIKYTANGCQIVISYAEVGDMIAITVEDNGDGIPDELKPRVFDMFYSGVQKIADSRRSLGLGLALCKSIVNAHGGEIEVRDSHPKGAAFTFTLPREEVDINE